MSTDLEQRITKLEEFAADVREFTAALKIIITRYDERLDEHDNLFRETDTKLAALVDAQIQTEGAIRRLTTQASETDERLNRLLAVVERHTQDGHGG